MEMITSLYKAANPAYMCRLSVMVSNHVHGLD